MHPPSRYSYQVIAFVALAVIGILLTVIAILHGDGVAPSHPADQGFIRADVRIHQSHNVWQFAYPKLQYSGGISASLFAGTYNLFVNPAIDVLNWHIKIFGAVLFVSLSALYFQLLLPGLIERSLALLLVVSSGFALLEPTSEIFAASFFLAFLCSALKRRVCLAAFFLALFGLAKVELLAGSAAALVLWVSFMADGKRRWWATGTFFGALFAMCAPAIYLYGSSGVVGSRAFEALSQHYAVLYCERAAAACPVPNAEAWERSETVMAMAFPGARSVGDVMRSYPAEYLSLLRSGIVKSLGAIFVTLNGLLVFAAFAICRRVDASRESRQMLGLILLASCLTWLPAVAFAFVHVRYVARFYPAIVGITFLLCFVPTDARSSRGLICRRIQIAVLVLTCILQTVFLWPAIAANPHGF